MKILLTGSTGYIGRRLLPHLVKAGHEVICPVRDQRRFDYEDFNDAFLKSVKVIEVDFLDLKTLNKLPHDIDVAYYFIHSLTSSSKNFSEMEMLTASNFSHYVSTTHIKQVIYLGGIANDNLLSDHLKSRQKVEEILEKPNVQLTVLRSAIIIGSGGASFEIIRDLVEKLPIMIAPKWLQSRCQPIAISNILEYLMGVLLNPASFGKTFDIGGKDILTYKEMLLQFSEVRGLKRWIITVPVLSLKLSSLWLYIVTSTSYQLARNLVGSMKNEVICKNNTIDDIVKINKLTYKEALERTFLKINQKNIVSSWKDSFSSPNFNISFMDQVDVPEYGCFTDKRSYTFDRDKAEVIDNIWEIGGDRGWYYGNFLWRLRGFLDKLFGGVGLRRGRRSPNDLKSGDALDFWRVIYANKKENRLLLFAEMRLPGDAWLEFRVKNENGVNRLVQTATFRPLGIWGRLYWYAVLPLHGLIFRGMAQNIINFRHNQ